MSSVKSSVKDLKAPEHFNEELELGTATTIQVSPELPWSAQYKALWTCKRSVFACRSPLRLSFVHVIDHNLKQPSPVHQQPF